MSTSNAERIELGTHPYLSLGFSFEIFVLFDICFSQLAEALYEYGRGNEKQALELLGPDFDANNCKVWSSSTDQCAPKCSQSFHLFEFLIWILLLYARRLVHPMNKLMYSTKSGTVCCWILDKLLRVRHKLFCCYQISPRLSFNCNFFNSSNWSNWKADQEAGRSPFPMVPFGTTLPCLWASFLVILF